jgi:hypothetical protein
MKYQKSTKHTIKNVLVDAQLSIQYFIFNSDNNSFEQPGPDHCTIKLDFSENYTTVIHVQARHNAPFILCLVAASGSWWLL